MKPFFIICFVFLLIPYSYSQDFRITSENKIVIDSIVNFDTTSSVRLYNAVKKWGASNFNNAKEVLVFDTPEEIHYRFLHNIDRIDFYTTAIIRIKDGKIKFEYSNINWLQNNTSLESVMITKQGQLRKNNIADKLMANFKIRFIKDIENINKALNQSNDW